MRHEVLTKQLRIIKVRGHPEFRDSSVGRAEDC